MNHFQHFKKDISGILLPDTFTFPFYYEPHTLAEIASEELQEYLINQTDFEHDFGIDSKDNESALGKMFGILVVKTRQNEIGYLAAFSGKLTDKSFPNRFVPPIFNIITNGSFYRKEEKKVEKLSKEINILKNDSVYLSLKIEFKKMTKIIKDDLAIQRKKMKFSKLNRKFRKKNAALTLDECQFEIVKKKLVQESFNDQFYYEELQEYYQNKIEKSKQQLENFENRISDLKKRRKKTSEIMQNWLFEQYQFLNQQKIEKGLIDIFNNVSIKPPGGAGDCAAPKLLQYAFQHDLTPIAMAEFWWGISPNSEIRKHKNYYPACKGRCKPILTHMLKGIRLDKNVIIQNLVKVKKLEIVFEDDAIIVVNKPAEFLSIPGKEIKDSVQTRIRKMYPNATGPLIVHRLDMSTSGILVLTKTKEANKQLQSQFVNRSVKKRYVALLEGKLIENSGTIHLPLRLDIEDRPRQLVDFKSGKLAETRWSVIEQKDNKTRVHFFPITGRTHQLRVHAAHKDGLNTPIVGDDLYGKKHDRLYLHAEFIEFQHPKSKEKLSFTVPASF